MWTILSQELFEIQFKRKKCARDEFGCEIGNNNIQTDVDVVFVLMFKTNFFDH